MSFGRAAASGRRDGFPTVSGDDACPCGSGKTFAGCCGPVIAGAPAPDPERLMRSRYTAFVIGDEKHLRATWHPGTCPDDFDLDPALTWTGLEMLDVAPDVVEFRASWRQGSDRGALHERSRFVFRGGRWWYLDGEIR